MPHFRAYAAGRSRLPTPDELTEAATHLSALLADLLKLEEDGTLEPADVRSMAAQLPLATRRMITAYQAQRDRMSVFARDVYGALPRVPERPRLRPERRVHADATIIDLDPSDVTEGRILEILPPSVAPDD